MEMTWGLEQGSTITLRCNETKLDAAHFHARSKQCVRTFLLAFVNGWVLIRCRRSETTCKLAILQSSHFGRGQVKDEGLRLKNVVFIYLKNVPLK